MCNKAVNSFLPALKFVPDWFVASKAIKELPTAFYPDENILYFNKNSGNTMFFYNEMRVLNINHNNINLDDTNYDDDNSETIILIRLLSWHIKFGKRKALKNR